MKKQLLSVTLGLSLVTFGAQAQNHGKMDHSSEQAENNHAPRRSEGVSEATGRCVRSQLGSEGSLRLF